VAFTAAAPTPGPHSHALPSRTVAAVLSRPDVDKWLAAIDEELGSSLKFEVWEEDHLLGEKQALPSFFIFEIPDCLGRCVCRERALMRISPDACQLGGLHDYAGYNANPTAIVKCLCIDLPPAASMCSK
jgi:hypothetical protein